MGVGGRGHGARGSFHFIYVPPARRPAASSLNRWWWGWRGRAASSLLPHPLSSSWADGGCTMVPCRRRLLPPCALAGQKEDTLPLLFFLLCFRCACCFADDRGRRGETPVWVEGWGGVSGGINRVRKGVGVALIQLVWVWLVRRREAKFQIQAALLGWANQPHHFWRFHSTPGARLFLQAHVVRHPPAGRGGTTTTPRSRRSGRPCPVRPRRLYRAPPPPGQAASDDVRVCWNSAAVLWS